MLSGLSVNYFACGSIREGAVAKSTLLSCRVAVLFGKRDSNHIKNIIGANQGDDGV